LLLFELKDVKPPSLIDEKGRHDDYRGGGAEPKCEMDLPAD
jgi:hypothetical protein